MHYTKPLTLITTLYLALTVAGPTNARSLNEGPNLTFVQAPFLDRETAKYVTYAEDVERLAVNIQKTFANLDKNKDNALSLEDRKLILEETQSKITESQLNELKPADLNKDQDLSEKEINTYLEQKNAQLEGQIPQYVTTRQTVIQQRITSLRNKTWEFDRNNDKHISFKEIQYVPSERLENAAYPKTNPLGKFLKFDKNNDGQTTVDEANKALLDIFYFIDSNHNNIITRAEAEEARSKTICPLPPPTPGTSVVALTLYSGPYHSTMATDGQKLENSAAYIEIEPGNTPLYLIINSYDVLWKIGGATDRIEHIALLAHQGGIADIPASKVTLADFSQCLGYASSRNAFSSSAAMKEALEQALPPSTPFANIHLGEKRGNSQPAAIYLPSGEVTTFEKDGAPLDTALFETFSQPKQDGFLYFSASKIISNKPAEPYELYGGEMGLKQLEEGGFIESLGNRTYYIKKYFKSLPAGLAGGNSVTFVLKDGVGAPESGHTHSCIYYESSRQSVTDRDMLCNRPYRGQVTKKEQFFHPKIIDQLPAPEIK